jgi:hypothetical protein
MIFIVCESSLEAAWGAPDPEAIPPRLSLAQPKGSRESDMITASSFISVLPIQGLVVCDAFGVMWSINPFSVSDIVFESPSLILSVGPTLDTVTSRARQCTCQTRQS